MSGRGPSIFLLLLGLWLIALGANRWYQQRTVSHIALKFMAAVVDGDPETALALLSADARQRATAVDEWPPVEDVELQVEEALVTGDTALVKMRIEKQQFLLYPHVHLERHDSGQWQVSQIENLEIDPRWEKFQNWEARQNGEELAEELHRQLQEAAAE